MPGRRSNPNVMRRPRVPLPRQRGGAHENKTRRPFRRRKHKKTGGGARRSEKPVWPLFLFVVVSNLRISRPRCNPSARESCR